MLSNKNGNQQKWGSITGNPVEMSTQQSQGFKQPNLGSSSYVALGVPVVTHPHARAYSHWQGCFTPLKPIVPSLNLIKSHIPSSKLPHRKMVVPFRNGLQLVDFLIFCIQVSFAQAAVTLTYQDGNHLHKRSWNVQGTSPLQSCTAPHGAETCRFWTDDVKIGHLLIGQNWPLVECFWAVAFNVC